MESLVIGEPMLTRHRHGCEQADGAPPSDAGRELGAPAESPHLVEVTACACTGFNACAGATHFSV